MSKKVDEKSVEEILNDASLKLLGMLNHKVEGKDIAVAFDYVRRCIRKFRMQIRTFCFGNPSTNFLRCTM